MTPADHLIAAESPVMDLECPCCGDVGAEADADGLFFDGQAITCGCNGHVVCDSENPADIWVDDCDCQEATR